MDTVSGFTSHSGFKTQVNLPNPTPIPQIINSNIPNTPSGDIPPPDFINSINELRSFSTAFSAFISRYDELQSHINFINSAIDSKLANHVVDVTTNPNKSAVTSLLELETCGDETVRGFTEGIVPEGSRKDFEGTDAWKEAEETVLETSCVSEAVVSEQNPNRTVADCEKVDANVRTPEILAETDVVKKTEETVPEAIVSEHNPNQTVADCEQVDENARMPESFAEIDLLKKPEEIGTLKETEETVKEIYCDQTIIAVTEAVVLEQNHNRTTAGYEQFDENARTPESLAELDVLKKPEEVDALKETEEMVEEICCDQTITAGPEAIVSEQNSNRTAADCEEVDENARTPESIAETDVLKKSEEIDTLKQTEETVPEICCDQTVKAVPAAIVLGQNCNGMADDCEQSHENVRTPERLEEIDTLKKPEQTDFCENPEEVNVLQKPEEISTSMNPEKIGTFKKCIRTKSRKSTKTIISNMSVISALEFLCQSMFSKQLRKHVAAHISEMVNLRHEIAKALKLAKDPAKLVLESIGRFYRQQGYTFRRKRQKAGRLAVVLILECFVMISSDGIKIAKQDREHAAAEAVIWRKRMINEGGVSEAEEVDARGLLLFISGFQIRDTVFTIQDITDLIRASNVKGIATALRRSVFLIPKIPEVIHLMVKNDLEVEAVDLAYTFGLEDMCHPQNILTTYLRKKLKDIQNGSSVQMLEAMKQQLYDLESVKKCLDSHNVDPSMLLPEFKINENIHNLEKEISEGKLFQKRKSSENLIRQEAKRACFGHENMTNLQKHVVKEPDIVNASVYPEEIDVFKKPVEIDDLKKHVEMDEPKKLEEINLTENLEEIDILKKHIETDTLKKPEETDNLKKPEETVPETSCDQTITIVAEAIVSEQSPNNMAGNCEWIHENVRTPEIPEEIGMLKKSEQTGISNKPEETDIINKPEQTDYCKNPEGTDALQKPDKTETSMNPEEKVRTPKILEEIDVSMKSEVIHTCGTSEQTDILNNPEEIGILKKPEHTDFCKSPEKVKTSKVLEEIDTSKKHEETGICKKAKKTKTSKNSLIYELEQMCRSMRSKKMRKHVAAHYSEMINLRHEIAKALKLAEYPAKNVLQSMRMFYAQGVGKNGYVNALRLASVLILECFLMISNDDTEIAKQAQEHAAGVAIIWRKRMISEGGLRPADEVDARGLLLLISAFGIQDHVFMIQDIMDLIRASNVKRIATVLRRSVFLIPKIPEVIYLMVKNNLEIEAVDLAYTFGLENACCTRNILSTYLDTKIKDIPTGSSLQMLEAMKQQLCDLKSVKECLESHNIDPSVLLPEYKINEKIQNLEKEINEGESIQKRKSSESPIHQEPKRVSEGELSQKRKSSESPIHQEPKHVSEGELSQNRKSSESPIHQEPKRVSEGESSQKCKSSESPIHQEPKRVSEGELIQKRKSSENPSRQKPKRACFGHKNVPHQQQHADHYHMNPSRHFDHNLSSSYSSVYNYIHAIPQNVPGPWSNGLAGGFHGSYDHMVRLANVHPYGWHGPYEQHYLWHGQAYDSQPYVRPHGQGLSYSGFPDTRPGFPGRRGPSSDLYRFADKVEKEYR